MRRKVLILTDTYFQLFVSVRLKQTVFCADEVDLIITDHSSGCEQVANRMKEETIFENVYFVHDDNSAEESFRDKVKRYLTARMAPQKTLYHYATLGEHYDIVLFSNPSLLAHLLCFCYRKQAECYRMEEGYSTYTRPLLVKKPLRRVMIRAAFGDLRKRLKGIYLFHPELFHQTVKYPILAMEPIGKHDIEIKNILNRVFRYEQIKEEYDARFIFLEEAFQPADVNVDNQKLIFRIAEIVGKENLIVKRHPRRITEFPSDTGIRVSKVAGIPWELILMNEDFTGKTLLTITSNSALAPALYAIDVNRVYLLHKCTEVQSPMMDQGYLNFVSQLIQSSDNVVVPMDMDDFKQKLYAQKEL